MKQLATTLMTVALLVTPCAYGSTAPVSDEDQPPIIILPPPPKAKVIAGDEDQPPIIILPPPPKAI
jgi:hypothetical protein